MEDVRQLFHTFDSDELKRLVTLLESTDMDQFLSVLNEEIVDREFMTQRRELEIRVIQESYESTLKKKQIDYKQEYYSKY